MQDASWLSDVDFNRVVRTLQEEATQDWYRDPWQWAEYGYLQRTKWLSAVARIRKPIATNPISPVMVPKENFGLRPAIVVDILDRVCYQTVVDKLSHQLIGSLAYDVYGWRLVPIAPIAGRYARNDFQWDNYRGRIGDLALHYDLGLKLDVSNFFASIDPEILVDRVTKLSSGPAVDRLSEMLLSWRDHHAQVGIPQRSTASSVLANSFLMDVDKQLEYDLGEAPADLTGLLSQPSRHKFARWMDDVWAFDFDESSLRSAQVALQDVLHRSHLALNSGKTRIYAGEDLVNTVMKIENSAIDDALLSGSSERLEALVDRLIEERERADRSAVSFASVRMRDHNFGYRIEDLLDVAPRMPHAAWPLAQLFRRFVPSSVMQSWLGDYVGGVWDLHQWSLGQYLFTIPAARKPSVRTRDLYVKFASSPDSGLVLTSASISRLSGWDPAITLDLVHDRMKWENDGHLRRVLALGAIGAGAKRGEVRKWLSTHEDCYLTMNMLEDTAFRPIRLPEYLG